jgi:hypothetical protein
MLLCVSNETCGMTQRISVKQNIIAVNLVVKQIEAEGRLNHRYPCTAAAGIAAMAMQVSWSVEFL